MLSIANVSAAQAENYYEKDDYYTQDVEAAASSTGTTQWHGKGAIALGLTGAVEPDTFKTLLHGQDLQGNCLHAREIDPTTHRAATDFTFSAPKSVSIAGLIQSDLRVVAAHDQAIKTSLSVLEERYAQTRLRTEQGRQKVVTGNITAAVFRHETSRELDPQLHSHCVVINTTQIAEGSWRSWSNEAAISNQKLLGEIYQNELAFQLRQRGYEIEPRENRQFELKGYDAQLLNTFSTRTQQIQTYLQNWEQTLQESAGVPLHASQKKQATLDTRKRKQVVPREVLLQGWQQAIQSGQLTLPNLHYAREVTKG
ncbi:MAG: relaxase domain-containing protein [Cyanothece sp. SIO1E1]|nr:relaxase domain-containing protein [Cyanothece sp. SIO1E1]